MSVNKLKIVAGIAIPDSKYDPGLLYASAVLHDLGLVPHYSS
ncbi:hypothetical protein [Niabella beijingensis]|nr:hypothetical protein [Niabella beijingensis]